LVFLLLERESGNTGQVLALQKLQGSSATGRDVRDAALHAPLGDSGGGITASNDRDGTIVCGLDNGIHGSLSALGKGIKLKDTSGSVPENGLGTQDGLGEDLVRLFTAVKSQPSVGNAGLISGVASLGSGREAVGSDVVDGQVELDALGLGSVDQLLNNLGAVLVEERVANL